jgi:hypothetical protein
VGSGEPIERRRKLTDVLQLVSAIGHEVTPVDFANYQRYHNRKLMREEYVPRPFMYAIRRPDHDPEGRRPAVDILQTGLMCCQVFSASKRSWTTGRWRIRSIRSVRRARRAGQ